MKLKYLLGILLCMAGLVTVSICILTDWDDQLFLPLALCFSVAGNLCNVLRFGRGKDGEENEK